MGLPGFINKYYKMFLNVAIIILAFIIGSNVYKNQLRLAESLKGKKDYEARKNTIIDDIGQLEKKIDSYKNSFNKTDVALTINIISGLAKESNVKIASIKPEGEKGYSAYIKYPFSLSVEAGNYHSIGKFISKLENHKNVYIVEGLNIKPPAAEVSQEVTLARPNLKMDLTISTIGIKE